MHIAHDSLSTRVFVGNPRAEECPERLCPLAPLQPSGTRTHSPRIRTFIVPGRQGIPVVSQPRKKGLELGAMVGRGLEEGYQDHRRRAEPVEHKTNLGIVVPLERRADLRESASRAATHAAV